MTDDDIKLWKKVTDTVSPLGTPQKPYKLHTAYTDLPAPSVLDLHGYSLTEAYTETMSMVEYTTHRKLTIITGKSGKIKQEFTRWLENNHRVKDIRAQNEGSYIVLIRAK